jgi:hypothetical protein
LTKEKARFFAADADQKRAMYEGSMRGVDCQVELTHFFIEN